MTEKLVLQTMFFDLVSEGKLDQAAEIFGEDAVFYFPGFPEMKGRRAIRRMLGMFFRRFSAIRWQTEPEIYVDREGLVVSRWKVRGVFATGKEYLNEGISLVHINSDGRVTSFKDYFTSTDFSDR